MACACDRENAEVNSGLTNLGGCLKIWGGNAKKPKWRNWQTRYVQGVVGIAPVRVQIPPSALAPKQPT